MMPAFKISLILLLFSACAKTTKQSTLTGDEAIPLVFVSKDITSVFNDTVFVKAEKLSGYVYELKDTDTVLLSGYKNGLLHGTTKKWFNKKQLMEERSYSNGMKNGKQTSYWENGNKRFEFIAVNDVYEGELKEWNVDGNLIHLAHFKNGQEEGEQKLWYNNGKIRANYVIHSGKRYGLLGTKNCINVTDSVFDFK